MLDRVRFCCATALNIPRLFARACDVFAIEYSIQNTQVGYSTAMYHVHSVTQSSIIHMMSTIVKSRQLIIKMTSVNNKSQAARGTFNGDAFT